MNNFERYDLFIGYQGRNKGFTTSLIRKAFLVWMREIAEETEFEELPASLEADGAVGQTDC